MKKFFVLALMLCLYGVGYANLCSSMHLIDANSGGLFIGFDDPACSGQTYTVRSRKDGVGAWSSPHSVFYPASYPKESFMIIGLDKCSNYEVEVVVRCNGVVQGTCYGNYMTEGCEQLECSSISVDATSETTADVTFDVVDLVACTDANDELEVRYRIREIGGTWSGYTVQTTTNGVLGLSGLTACMEYEIEVSLICQGAPTTYCSYLFSTDCTGGLDCSGVDAVGTGDTYTYISLLGFEDCEYGYNNQKTVHIWWGPVGQGFPFNNSFNIAGDYYRIQNLTPCTEYEYEVYVQCDGEWKGPCTGKFTTTGDNCLVNAVDPAPEKGKKMDLSNFYTMNSVKAYPSPFTNDFTLEFQQDRTEVVSVTIHDALGRLVYQGEESVNEGPAQIRIDGSDLPVGMLIYTLKTSETQVSGRLIKQ